MVLDRRMFLAAAPGLVAWSAFAEAVPAALQDYERATAGKVGLYAENTVTGAKIVWRAYERFAMCSTFKASLAALVLARVDQGREKLDGMISYGPKELLEYAPAAKLNLAKGAMSVADMCEAAVELSDNTCANLLLARVGGPAALTEFWRKTGDAVTRLDHNEPKLNFPPPGDPSDTTTPAAMAGNLRRFVLGSVLSPASRQRLTGWMLNCKTGDHRLHAGLPKDWVVGDKTGNSGKDAAGDIAVAWPKPDTPVLIAAYVRGGKPSPEQLERVFTEIGRLVGERLV